MSTRITNDEQNNITNNNEGNISLKKQNDSFLPQSESYTFKVHSRSKFQQKQRSKRRNKLKDLRRNGNPKGVPKDPPKTNNTVLPENDSVEYVHQSLAEHLFSSSLIDQIRQTVTSIDSGNDASSLIDVLETVGMLAIALPTCKTPLQIANQFLLAIKSLTKGSLTEVILRQSDTIEWFKSIFGYNVFQPQAGEVNSVEWLKDIPSLQENWQAAKNAPLFGKISSMISIAASIGLCNVSNLTWSIGGVNLFRAGTIKKHQSAIDLVGAVLDTLVCFVEGGYECFRQKSFRPLLFSSDEGIEFDDMYFSLLELHEHAMVFNLHSKPVTIKGERRTVSDLEYGQLLDEAIELADRAYKSAKGTWQQGCLEKRKEILIKNRAAYQAKRIDGSMRYAPFTIYVWGGSGVGKSTIAQVLMADCLAAAGVDPHAKGTAILKESDKFDSSLKGDTVGIYLDDFGNGKNSSKEGSPTDRIIDISNNMITYANKADLHEKAKIEVRPVIFIITSNAPLSHHANNGSIEPFSIVRRAHLHIEVFAKEEFALPDQRLDSSKVFRSFSGDSLVNDVWDLDLYVPRDKRHGGNSSSLESLAGLGNRTRCTLKYALLKATAMCEKHFEEQRELVRKGEGLVASRKYCKDCRRASDICQCEHSEYARRRDGPGEDLLSDIMTNVGVTGLVIDDDEEDQVEELETFESISAQFEDIGEKLNYAMEFVPNYVRDNEVIQKLYMLYYAREFLSYERSIRYLALMSLIVAWLFSIFVLPLGAIFIVLFLCLDIMFYLSMLSRWKDQKYIDLAKRKDITIKMFESIRKSKMLKFFSFCVMARLVYKCIEVYKAARAIQQSALAPDNVAEIVQRDAEVNPWAKAVVAELHVNDKVSTMTHDQVVAKVSNNLLHATFVENNFQQSCDILALGGNVYLMPLHVFKNRNDMRATITRKDPSLLNSTFKAFVSKEYMIPIKGKDLCIVSISSGGVFADIKHLFPDTITANGVATFLYKTRTGELKSDPIRLNYISNSESGGAGFSYNLPYNTFTGLCMGVSVAKYARNCIACVHLRGVSDTPKGKGLTVTRTELEDVISIAHKKWHGAFPSTVNGTFPVQRYEKQVLVDQTIHPKSPINYLPIGSTVEYLGQNNMRVSHTKSKVKKTPISDTVAEVTSVPCDHGPPKFHSYKMWQASLAHSANPSPGIEGSLVRKAYDDYVDHLLTTFTQPEFKDWIHSELKPLSNMENICGKDGKRFIDAMKKGTSKGFPLSGPKRDMINELDPLDYPDFQCPAEAHPEIIAEFEKMEKSLLNGERCYSIFKACVKDEPTKIGKDKVRVFQAADWATQMLVRKYFLPIARILSLFPLDSECAVGVNAQGPEWDQLARHMKKYGKDRILAGDYSKYDLRMPAQIINASFAVLIEIAEKCGQYSEDDLKIMRGIATEIAYSCVAYNGDIIIHLGSNPSGQNMTVYINCIANSLKLRCSYFHLWPNKDVAPPPFREAAAVMTYGDDVKGSVKRGFDWFNHISYAKFLKERDMVFTMPDKESEPTPYMNDDDADFLKRKNVFNPDTQMYHGALHEDSIFKSLHTVLESKVVSLEEQSICNIDGALREWWQHGRELYELRRGQMKEVAERCNISQFCNMLNESYEDRLLNFNKTYLTKEENMEDTFVTTVHEDEEDD